MRHIFYLFTTMLKITHSKLNYFAFLISITKRDQIKIGIIWFDML